MFRAHELPTVVLVEDSDEDADTVQTAFARSGVTATLRRVASGDACIALLKTPGQALPALVVMDLNTPGMDGRQALSFIKSDSLLKAIPVVISSTSASPQDRDFCYAAGANAYHVKPIRHPDHLQAVEALLQYWLVEVALPAEGHSA
jgi:CheY-like chemotaxis protein